MASNETFSKLFDGFSGFYALAETAQMGSTQLNCLPCMYTIIGLGYLEAWC